MDTTVSYLLFSLVWSAAWWIVGANVAHFYRRIRP